MRTVNVQLEAEAPRPDRRPHARVEEGGRQLHAGRLDRALRRADRPSNAAQEAQAHQPGRRFATWSDFEEVTRTEPEKSLVEGITKTGGRNSYGRITSRHRGGGAKRRYRMIDFKRRKDGVPAKVATIEYDPNRTAYIALLHYADGEKRYILAPQRAEGRRRS